MCTTGLAMLVFLVGISAVWKVASLPCTFDSVSGFLDCGSRELHHIPTENIHFDNAEEIDLSGNKLGRIKNETFSKNSALKCLDLSYNVITHLETRAFGGLDHLAILNLSGNGIALSPDVLTPELFEPLVALREIRMQHMSVPVSEWRGIDTTFQMLKNLTKLYIDFPPEFVFGIGFSELTKLKTVSTAGRRREYNGCNLRALRNSTFSVLWEVNITELRLINCGIDTIENGTFDPLTALDTLDLSNNINLGLAQAIKSLRSFNNREMKEIRLARLNNGSLSGFLDCGSRELHHIPTENIHFDNAEEIDLSGNKLRRIINETFSKNSALKYLDLSYNVITDLETRAFGGLDHLAILNLSGNGIALSPDVLTPELFEPLVALREIRMQHMSVPVSQWRGIDATFQMLKNLTKLYIDFPPEFVFGIGFSELTKLKTVSTAGRWRQYSECNLRALRNSTFSVLWEVNITELRLINCGIDTIENGTFDPLTALDTLDLSNNINLGLVQAIKSLRSFNNREMKEIRLARLNNNSFSMLILLLVVMYRYRTNLRYWLYTRLQPPKDMFAEQEYVFDAFVAYTSEERKWVSQQLFPNLELPENSFKLCIHDRDFTPGKPIHENIVDKMRESRKILLIISQHFLESTYGPLEIEYAVMKSLSDGRDDIILCVLMEDIPVRHMPKALRNLWHKITFLKWSADQAEQVIFWRSLIEALD
ncbi:toll-like receptor Tollo [Liolophura sinensis]|uniref:toll-like receptor Tollo n=1 Tax=Liolophura sinensis TaxID=3198878 RepID=UPI00315802AE